jgi:hypothetical protein
LQLALYLSIRLALPDNTHRYVMAKSIDRSSTQQTSGQNLDVIQVIAANSKIADEHRKTIDIPDLSNQVMDWLFPTTHKRYLRHVFLLRKLTYQEKVGSRRLHSQLLTSTYDDSKLHS